MLPTEVLSRVLAAQPVLDAIARDQAGPRAAFDTLVIGQAVTGLVKSSTKGVTLVEIAGETVAMRLPQAVAAGDTLKLSFAGHMPQPVFVLDTPETARTETTQFSQTARMLSDIMQRVPERTPPILTPPGPLLDQPTTNPGELALTLRTALVRSGLFYESHLADWAVGLDSLDGLMQEPQNQKLMTDAARGTLSAAHATALNEAETAITTALPGTSVAVEADQKTANPMLTLLSQQLQVLESPNFVWRGELWPGQMLEWQVRQDQDQPADDPTRSATTQPEATTAWESHLKLTLPQLGTVNVHIRLDASQAFSIKMVPEQPDTGPLLQKNQTQLAEQLVTAGCTINSVTVQNDAHA
jgi:hypothetical protein